MTPFSYSPFFIVSFWFSEKMPSSEARVFLFWRFPWYNFEFCHEFESFTKIYDKSQVPEWLTNQIEKYEKDWAKCTVAWQIFKWGRTFYQSKREIKIGTNGKFQAYRFRKSVFLVIVQNLACLSSLIQSYYFRSFLFDWNFF